MTVYIVLFRGVGGATQLPVKPLRAALESAGFENVATYINSGNAVVKSQLAKKKVHATITELCEREFAFTKDIHVVTATDWSQLISRNPFSEAADVGQFLHAVVLAEKPAPGKIKAVQALAKDGERFEVVGGVAYIHTPKGFGTSKLAERFDKVIGVANTARNWNTVVKLAELAEAAK